MALFQSTMKSERMEVRISRLHTLRNSKTIRYLLFTASWFMVAVIFCIIPYLKGAIITILADNNFQFAPNHPPAKIAWSITPLSVTVSSIHIETRDRSDGIPYIFEVHLDSIQYRAEIARFWRMKHLDANVPLTGTAFSPNFFTTLFATISWNNLTVLVHEPHPQPRLSILDGTIRLSSLSIRQQMRRFSSLRTSMLIPYSQSALLQLSIAKIGITTHSVTSVPIPITHPTTRQLVDRFPTFFSLFTTPASFMPDGAINEYPIIYPPHLSLLAPSIVFPALYQGISSFRQGNQQDDSKKDETYNFPTPFPHAIIQANFTRDGARRMREMSLALIDESETPYQCAPIHVGGIKSVNLSGRDANGKGGCCTFQVRDFGNLPTPIGHSNDPTFILDPVALSSLLNRSLNWLIDQSERSATLLAHPYYLTAFVIYFKTHISNGNRIDLCALRRMIQYHIGEFEWIDQTPTTTATVARALAQVHNGFLNLFEGAVGLVA